MDFTYLKNVLDQIPSYGAPGVDCIVQIGYETVFRHQAGYADREKQIPMTGNELFNLYSTTKPITCVAALQLFEQGKFLLNEPLSEYLPEFKDMEVSCDSPVSVVCPITIGQVFSMSAGFSYDLNMPRIRDVVKQTNGKAPTREVIRAMASQPLDYEPGTAWGYSLAHDVLGALIEVVSGESFGDYLKRHIFEPLEMHRTGFERTKKVQEQMMAQYRRDPLTGEINRIGLENEYVLGDAYESGGAGLVSCTEDYAKFAAVLANDGVAANGVRILGKATMDLMRTNRLDKKQLQILHTRFPWLKGYGYALGVRTHIDSVESGSLSPLGEFGWDGAAGAFLMADPVNQISMFYAQHMREGLGYYVHPRLRNALYAGL